VKKLLLYLFDFIVDKPSLPKTPQDQDKPLIKSRPPWKSKTLQAAVILSIFGGVFFNNQLSDFRSNIKTSELKTSQKPETNLPLSLKIGSAYFIGFITGWGLRRFLKLSMLLGTIAIIIIGILKKSGWIDLDFALLEQNVKYVITRLNGEVLALKEMITGLLPSAGTAGIGIFQGFRWK
jgi:uncharacterized membrane protein (Fun14 family)